MIEAYKDADSNYPNEGFIQKAIEEYLESRGFKILNVKYTYLVCIHPGMKWSVRPKVKQKQRDGGRPEGLREKYINPVVLKLL